MQQQFTTMAQLFSLIHPFSHPTSSLNLVTFLLMSTFFSLTTGNITSFTHHLVFYECDPSRTVYRFQYAPENPDKPSLGEVVPRESLFQLKEVGSEYFVETSGDRRTTPLSNFSFRVLTTRLIVEVTGEVRPCDESSSTRCTILISVLASLCLLLFAGLALSLIVLKERRVPCIHKLTAWIQSRRRGREGEEKESGGGQNQGQEQEQQHQPSAAAKRSSALAPDDIDLEHLKRIYEKGINSSKNSKNHYKSSPSIEDSPPPPVPPVNKPRKSSLKPPRTEAYPAPGSITLQPEGLQESPSETGVSTSPGIANPVLNGGRRKSIVTFNERTEIRT